MTSESAGILQEKKYKHRQRGGECGNGFCSGQIYLLTRGLAGIFRLSRAYFLRCCNWYTVLYCTVLVCRHSGKRRRTVVRAPACVLHPCAGSYYSLILIHFALRCVALRLGAAPRPVRGMVPDMATHFVRRRNALRGGGGTNCCKRAGGPALEGRYAHPAALTHRAKRPHSGGGHRAPSRLYCYFYSSRDSLFILQHQPSKRSHKIYCFFPLLFVALLNSESRRRRKGSSVCVSCLVSFACNQAKPNRIEPNQTKPNE